MKRVAFIIIMFTGTISGFAQSELTLPFMGNIFQNTYLNPAVQTEHSVSIGLPGLSSFQFQIISNGFIPHRFLSIADNTLSISPANLESQLRNRNLLYLNAGVDLLHVKIRIQNWDIWYGTRQNHQLSLFYPKSLVSLAIMGNEQYIDKPMDLTPMGVNGVLYREHTVGASTQRGKWVFGARASLLHGLTNVYLKPNNLSVTITDDMYSMTTDADAVLRTSGLPGDSLANINFSQFGVFDETDISSFSDFKEFMKTNYTANYLSRFRNPGFALSAGASYKYDSRFTFSFAFSDLGFISWSDSTKQYSARGESDFKGVDALGDMLNGDEFSVQSLVDGFASNFAAEEGHQVSYATWLHTKLYLSATYQLAQRTQVNASFYGVVNRGFYPAFTLGFNQGLGRMLNIALSASMNQRTISNIGFGLLVKPGPFQLYVVADNLYSPLVDPLTFTNMNVRVGLNIVIGWVKKPQGLPYK